MRSCRTISLSKAAVFGKSEAARAASGLFEGIGLHSLDRLISSRLGRPEQLLACYEAGPTGYGLYRLLSPMGG